MRLELTRVGLLVELANHYTTGLQLPLTHIPFEQSVRYIFLKNCVPRLYCVVVMILHADVYVLCGYRTVTLILKLFVFD